ncbi:putative E3 ubiquitin-protein ligase rbrA [Colletotrichum fructicola]|nr:uncharacterized protein CGMCC3_g5237 [Colletotrichum fructicola]KAE9578869.1 hypothetical protein CGMCC3_g5237 [Colletotrichum fructicola]KAF4423491.1 putative E3 ubiquitin-protein ligase rbrA [Colletotrichum fructicola]KAF4904706.1 putative E3 ubiquitin-protein ligase rbrA [Colletotrichum fructicola]KAF4915341.1 putative E3 ubiquitin-protein ligase rbrA [Colletotrichum fructicola]KAF4940168.1 putative E3 ubiquitin-protein ligase rbrA [Colletotrichum fructicola]
MSTATETVVEMDAATSMPARLERYAGFYGDPFLTLQDYEVKRKPVNAAKGKEKALPPVPATNTESELATIDSYDEVDDADLEKCKPPAALKTAPNITDGILLEVLQTSIENVEARIVENNRRRQLEETSRLEEEEAAKEDKRKEPYLPIIMVPDEPEPSKEEVDESDRQLKLLTDLPGNGEGSSGGGLIVFPIKPKKRSRFTLTRMLQKITEKEAPLSTRNPFKFAGNSSSNSLGSSDENKTKKSPVVECVSCLDDFDPKDVIKVTCHSYCRDCFERLIAAAVQNEQQWPPKCCLNEIPFRTVHRYVSKDLGKTYKDRSAEWKIPVSDRIYCNQPECSLWIKPDHVNNGLRIARCSNGHWTCTICRGPQHENSDCPQDRDMALTNALAEEEGWQHCAKCQALVEHREACQHMTCRCGHQFCYVCGVKWRGCACTMDQLNEVKAGAATRRARRIEREAEADAELRDALRQIEEFEREEALKAELLRQEMERREEERRQRELEERVRLESLRRHEIETKYQELREMLDGLHDVQEVMVRYQHDKELQISAHEASTATDELVEKQRAELATLAEVATQKLAVKEQALASEYSCRVLEEKMTEEIYLRDLENFYAGQLSSEERIKELMHDLCKKMDKGWRAWTKWRNDEFDRYQLKVEEERTMREEVMYSIKQRHEESLAESKKQNVRRQAAESRWVTLVFAERTRVLGDMEAAELEAGSRWVEELEAGELGDGAESWYTEEEEALEENPVGIAS